MNLRSFICVLFLLFGMACSRKKPDDSVQRIFDRNELTVLIRANSVDYFIYRGFPMGFQLELTRLFAKHLEVKLNVIATEHSEENIRKIRHQKIDIVASNVQIIPSKKHKICNLPFETEHDVYWEIACEADSLKQALIPWIDSISKTLEFKNLCLKYHVHPRRGFLQSDTSSQSPKRLSPYDAIIKKHSKKLYWDWRLLASMIYQESQFFPDAVSWAGAIGLMQMMPEVAGKYGVSLESSPDEQILAGVKYLQLINKILPKEISHSERIPFMLATYNVGIGHILDARRLAVVNDKDPNVWFGNVEQELLKKADRTIVRDSIVRYGYARGQETVNYVHDILSRWKHYQNLIK